MLLPLLLLAQDSATIDAALAAHREKMRADVPCSVNRDENEIVVCARRDADRFRVPLVIADAGREASGARMGRLLSADAAGYVPCGKGAFLVRCGSVGVGVSIDGGGGARVAERPLAP